MSLTLVIVESPSKARTIQKYLDSGYRVVASFGHIMDLPEKEFGVDIENEFMPDLVVTRKATKTVKEIKSIAKNADKILLAADPDREGEAICYHLSTLFPQKKSIISRIELHEITKKALLEALKSPQKIKMDLVESQMTRRVLDRIVGYKLSPVLWKHLHNTGLSAGRVQSVVLRWICEREIEIQNFKPEEYWRLSVNTNNSKGEELVLKFNDPNSKVNSKNKVKEIWETIFEKNDRFDKNFTNEIDVKDFERYLKVTNFKSEFKKKFPPPPFITASLQKEAGGKLKFSTKKTMSVAQKLYEGIYLGKEFGTTGLITYMRTDSTRLSEDFQKKSKSFIEENFGKDYIGNYRTKNTKPEIQDAHEAIRPVDTFITPDKIKQYLQPDEWNLYNLIWLRTLASQMNPEEGINQTVEAQILDYQFTAHGRSISFDGFTRVYPDFKKDKPIPNLGIGEKLRIMKVFSEQKYSEPPARYTEASIVEKMEKEGIGRPSTYSNSIEILYKRKYAFQKQKSILPTELGFEVNTFLTEKIFYLFENHFTRDVEEDLDKIASGSLKRVTFLNTFYKKFQTSLKEIEFSKPISKKKKAETDILCPDCKNRLLKRKNSKGKSFLICSKFPNCEYMKYT